jgi:large subunit ribosomal protein L25
VEQIKLVGSLREGKGKIAVKKLRASGLVPAIVYHRGEEAVSITVNSKELSRIIRSAGNENILINLTIEKEKKPKARAVLIKEIQHHPVRQDILHVDFNEISLTEKVIVEVEIVAVGESIGVKQDGGVLDHPLRIVKVQCLPTDIPKNITVDVSALKINDAVHVKDLVLSDKIKVLNDPETLLLQVKVHEEEKVAEATAETPELEVIREKKEEEAKPGEKAAKEEPKKEAAAPKAEKK